MSLCDSCYAPGQCCKAISLFIPRGEFFVPHDKDPAEFLRDFTPQAAALPFVPSRAKTEAEAYREPGNLAVRADGSAWWWSCTRLTPEGRCGDYENRPDMCRTFEPGVDSLCVHYRGAEGAEG